MSDTKTASEYGQLAGLELAAAATAADADRRRVHLDQAAIYAFLSETGQTRPFQAVIGAKE